MSAQRKPDDLTLPELVRVRNLVDYGLTRADAARVMQLARPVVHLPGSRSVYVKRDAVEAVLSECESWTA